MNRFDEVFGHRSIVTESGCIEFQGWVNPNGYCHTYFKGRSVRVHRLAYEIANGPIPEGLHIDHLCRNRICIRPDHLEAVTQAENNLRAGEVRRENHPTCIKGHLFSEENTLVARSRGRRPSRACRQCRRESNRAYHLRKKATQNA